MSTSSLNLSGTKALNAIYNSNENISIISSCIEQGSNVENSIELVEAEIIHTVDKKTCKDLCLQKNTPQHNIFDRKIKLNNKAKSCIFKDANEALTQQLLDQLYPLNNFICDLKSKYVSALNALGEKPAASKALKLQLDRAIFKLKLFELSNNIEAQYIEEFALYLLNEFSKDSDLFRLELPFEKPTNKVESIKNILYCVQFPGLLLLAIMGTTHTYSVGGFTTTQLIIPMLGSCSIMIFMLSGAYSFIDFTKKVKNDFKNGSLIDGIKTFLRLTIASLAALWSTGADPNTAAITGYRLSGSTLATTFFVSTLISKALISLKGTYLLVEQFKYRFSGNNAMYEQAILNYEALTNFIALGMEKESQVKNIFKSSLAKNCDKEKRIELYKVMKNLLLPPIQKNETTMLSVIQTQLRTLARMSVEKLDVSVRLSLENLIKLNKSPQKLSVLVTSFHLFLLFVFTLGVLSSLGTLLPASFLTRSAVKTYGVDFNSENNISFPVVEANVNTNKTHICNKNSDELFEAFGYGAFLAGIRVYSDLVTFSLYYFLPYFLQALSAEGMALDFMVNFLAVLSAIKGLFVINKKITSVQNGSYRQRFEKISHLLCPIKTKSYLIAFTSGTLGASIFTIAYLTNLTSALPKATKLFSLISCMFSGKITDASQVLAMVTGYTVYFTILPVLLATIPMMIGGLHCLFASIASNKRIPAYKQQVEVLSVAEKGELLEKSNLNKLTTFVNEEFIHNIKQLMEKLNLDEIEKIVNAYRVMSPLEKESLKHVGLDEQIHLAEKVCENFKLLESNKTTIDNFVRNMINNILEYVHINNNLNTKLDIAMETSVL